VRKIGLPDPNYIIDWDDMIYGYQGMVRGYTAFVDQSSVVVHQMGALETLRSPYGIRFIKIFDMSPMRSYYRWRNSSYFWVYIYQRAHSVMPIIIHLMRFWWWFIRVALFVRAPVTILSACLRGLWDGIARGLKNRY
jgi:GT2 family glycosyltransferase